MEIEGEDGSKLFLKAGAKTVFGRGSGFGTEDLTLSRHHVAFELKPPSAGTGPSTRVSFEVLGRNPIWVRTQTSGKIRTFRKSETGEVAAGDRFCVSGQRPVWFTLKKRDDVAGESVSESEIGLDSVDISDIDPVKEFGFLVVGREFEQYPKNRVRDIKQWEWFLEEPGKGNGDSDEDDNEEEKGRRGSGRKTRRRKGNEDEDWTGESEEDKEMTVKMRRVQKPYSTRSKNPKKDVRKSGSSSAQRKRGQVEEEEEDDETLGGFIVSDEEAELEEEEEPSEEEQEEEDFDEDEDEEE